MHKENYRETNYRIKKASISDCDYLFLQFEHKVPGLIFNKSHWYYIPKIFRIKAGRFDFRCDNPNIEFHIHIFAWESRLKLLSFSDKYPNIEMYIDKYTDGKRYGKEED